MGDVGLRHLLFTLDRNEVFRWGRVCVRAGRRGGGEGEYRARGAWEVARSVLGSRSRVGVLAVKQDAHNTTLGALRDPGRENNVLLAHFRALHCVTLEATAITLQVIITTISTAITSITAAVLAILNHQHRTRTSLTQ